MSAFVWLRLIMSQTLIDSHRRHLGRQLRDADREVGLGGPSFAPTTSASLAAQLAGRVTPPSQAAARAEAAGQLEQAIAEMEPIDQEILALRHFEELSNSEVAEVLKIQKKAASIRYVRALRRLRTILVKMPGFSEENDHA
jgi:RNA polymerase sigma-70 factor (ECF subfamily)